MTHATEQLLRLVRPLNEAGIPYMVTGGLAAIVYGEPRLTNDIDVVLQLAPHDAERLVAAFPATGFYVPPIETLREEAARTSHGHFNVLDLETAVRADVYCLGNDPLGHWAMPLRRAVAFGGETIWIAPIEYVILQKLRYYRDGGSDRHLRDIAAMRQVSPALIDQTTMEEWIDRLGLRHEWEAAARTATREAAE